MHPLRSVGEGLVNLLVGSVLPVLVENDWVCKMLAHLFDLFLPLIFLGLLADFEEVRVEDLVRVERVRVRIILLVVSLVHALQLVVALGDARDRDALVEAWVPVRRRLFLAGVQFVALVFKNEDHAIGDAQELGGPLANLTALFELEEELYDVEVGDEMLDLPIAALVHLENRWKSLEDLLFEDELRPVALSIFLVWQVPEQQADFDLVFCSNLLNQIHGNLLGDLLCTKHILKDSVEGLDEELD